MKSCPTCNRTFEDTWTFCLADGTLLSAPYDPQATQRLPAARITDPPPTQPARAAEEAAPTITAPPPRAESAGRNQAPAYAARPRSKASLVWLILAAAVASIVAFYALSGRDRVTTAGNKSKPEATPSATASESPAFPSPAAGKTEETHQRDATPRPTPSAQDSGGARAVEKVRAILGRNTSACQISQILDVSVMLRRGLPERWRVRARVVMAVSGSPLTETLEWDTDERGEPTPASQLTAEVSHGCP